MKIHTKLLLILVVSNWVFLVFLFSAQEKVQAKIGILVQSGKKTSQARHNQKIKAGDKLRVYVFPFSDAYIYLVYSNKKQVSLLNAASEPTKVGKGTLLTLPSTEDFYSFDGDSKIEALTLICSPKRLKNLEHFLNSENLNYQRWRERETALEQKSEIELSEQTQMAPDIAGNVRTFDLVPALDDLQTFSGKSFLIKRYQFRVKK